MFQLTHSDDGYPSELECIDLTTSYLDGSIVSEGNTTGTCILPFEDGIAMQNGTRNQDCNSMNRETCDCCEQADFGCGENPLRLKQCPQWIEINELSWNLEMELADRIAMEYVYAE